MLGNQIHDFDIYFHSTWNWIEEVVKHPKIASQIEWNTSDYWWDIQTTLNTDPSLGSNAKPLLLLIYTDKNKLSTFGTTKGYPVIAQIGNVPSDLRGRWVIRWHPIIPEDAQHSDKKGFADFKAVVWHKLALKMFESLLEYS
uniref:Uncharacterized protein n=1 Tax=Moniliophthora roreri TaxID=221103 RepID=A0A0W0FXB3_MONRR